VVETEPGISAIVYRLGDAARYSRPQPETKRAVLYVAHQSSDAELRHEPLIRELIEAGPEATFYTVDVRGTGKYRSCVANQFISTATLELLCRVHAQHEVPINPSTPVR